MTKETLLSLNNKTLFNEDGNCLVLYFWNLFKNFNLNFSEKNERNDSIYDVREQLRNEMNHQEAVHKQEFEDISDKFKVI